MAVLPTDLVLPVGSMPSDWHSTESLEEWIALGYAVVPLEATEPQADGIVTQYAYYRGYLAKAAELLGSPDNLSLPGGLSIAQSNGRCDRMLAIAESYRLAFEAAIVAVTYVEPEPELYVSRSGSAPIFYRWA
jgi:hypothetical protein